MAINKVVNIDVNATAAQQALDKFGGTLEDLYGEGVQPLNFAIGELEDRLYEMAAAGQSGTQEFKDMAAEVGRMKQVIMETDLTVDGMAQTMSQSVGGAIGGLASGFELSQGAMAAFGVESQAVEEALLKVQSAMAISQGIQGIREAIPSFNALKVAIAKTAAGQWLLNAAQTAGAVGMKVLNAVMNANPVFLLITGITALVGAIIYFTRETETAADMNEKLNASYQKSSELLDKVTKNTQRRTAHELKMLEIAGASEEELHKKRLSNMEEERKLRQIDLQLQQKNIEEKRKIYKKALDEGDSETAESMKTEIAESKKRYDELMGQHKDYIYSKQEENAQYQKKVEEEAAATKEKEKADYKERLEKWKQFQADKLRVAREIEDLQLSVLYDNQQKQLDILDTQLERQRQDTLKRTDLTESQKAEIVTLYEEQARQERLRIDEEFRIEMKARDLEDIENELVYQDARKLQFQDNMQYETNIFKDHMEQRAAANAEAMSKMEDASRGYTDAAMQGLQALDELNSMLTDDAVKKAGANEAAAEKARKKGFERSKKLQLTMAIITGVQGVMAAFTAGSSMGPAGVVMGPVMAALAAVGAAVNIAKIAKMKYEGGGGGTSVGGSTPSAPSVPSASFNVVGGGGANQLAALAGGQSEQQPIQAYVVSGEVTTAQSLDRNRVENASL